MGRPSLYNRRTSQWLAAVVGLLVVSACGSRPPPPARAVIETSIAAWSFRRYQKVLDVEVWVAANSGVSHTASYVDKSVLKRGRLADGDVVNAFVTRYQRDPGILRALVVFVRRLAQESGYTVDETRLTGTRIFLVTGHGEAWALWAAPRHVVKIGGRGVRAIPAALVAGYSRYYPSVLHAGMLEGPLPPDASRGDTEPEPRNYDPANPTPDWRKKK